MAQTNYKSSDLPGIDLYAIDTSQKHIFNTVIRGFSKDYGPGEFIYLKGVASTVEGSVVTYDEVGVTTLIAANAKGPVAVALGAVDAATKFGWYQIYGKAAVKTTATADNATVGREGADGQVGDARAAGDQIYGMIARSAQDTPVADMSWVQIFTRPFVDDFGGA